MQTANIETLLLSRIRSSTLGHLVVVKSSSSDTLSADVNVWGDKIHHAVDDDSRLSLK